MLACLPDMGYYGYTAWSREESAVTETQSVAENFFIQLIAHIWVWFENLVYLFWNGLGWPHTALMIFIVGVCCFRTELKDVISRIKSVGASGFEVRAKSQKAQGVAPDLNVAQSDDVESSYTFGLMLEAVDKDLSNVPEHNLVEALRRVSAYWRMVYVFENIYSFIFGGQLSLLWMLNQLGDNGMSMTEVEREWLAYKERFKPSLDTWEIGPFLQFLYLNELAKERDGVLKVTTKGREFLVWMTKTGRPSVRPW